MTTKQLINEHNKSFSTYYRNGFYTHTPMALVALRDLGASEERILDFYRRSVKKLDPIRTPKDVIDERNWRSFLGQQSQEASYFLFFEKIVKQKGVNQTLKEYFDPLMVGVGAAAFHPLIRLSYAIQEENSEEVILSLASWAASFLDLNIDENLTEEGGLLEVLHSFKEEGFHQNQSFQGHSITSRMYKAAQTELYQQLNSKISLQNLESSNLEEALLWLYSQSESFTLLHGVTSHHAFESLLKYSMNKDGARVLFWKSILAAYLSISGEVEIDLNWEYPSCGSLPDWTVLKERAIQSNDEHVVKLVHVLSVKTNSTLDYKLRFAAALKLGLINY